MKDKKLQVFVSSTYSDLKEERQAAVEAILSSGNIPAGMELFSAGDESQMSVIKRWIDESDVYLLLLGGRYGSIEPKSGKSYTHLEYEYAVQLKKPSFSIVITEKALEEKIKLSGSSVIEQDNSKLLKEFKNIVLSNLVKFWDDKKDIKIAIHETISEFAYRKDLVGWIRGDYSVNTGFLAEELAKLTKENAELRDKIASINSYTDNVLYANLTFEQLQELLSSDYVTIANEEINLFRYLLQAGSIFTRNVNFERTQRNIPDKLALYRILKINELDGGYSFTEDGHRFYLKALLHDRQRSKE